MAKVIDAVLRLRDQFTVTMDKATQSMIASTRQAARTASQLEKTGKAFHDTGEQLTKNVSVPLAGLATTLIKTSTDFEEAEDKIRADTGKTGAALESMMNDLKTVYSAVPSSLDDTTTAIAGLNQRLGLTGMPLQAVSTQILNLVRITGTDLSTEIASSARMFQDAGIKQKDYASALDYVYRVTQKTGVGMDTLQQQMVLYGAPLREMGFNWQQSAAMLGQFEQAGVNTELVMGSMRIALGKMAKGGITDPTKALSTMVSEIKNAGTVGKANALALQMFGQRAGPDMAAAIREGHLNLNALLASVKNSPDTINKAAQATMTPMQRLTVIWHQMQVSLSPVGNSLVSMLEKFQPQIQAVANKVKQLADDFNKLSPAQQSIVVKLLALAAVTGPVLMRMGGLIKTLGEIKDSFTKVQKNIRDAGSILQWLNSPAHIAVIAIIAIIVVIAVLIRYWPQISAFIKRATDGVKGVGATLNGLRTGALNGIHSAISTVQAKFNAFSNTLKKHEVAIKAVASTLALIFGPALIKTGVEATVAGAKLLAGFVSSVAKTGAEAVVSGAKLTVSFIGSVVKAGVQAVISGAKMTVSFIGSLLKASAAAVVTAAQITGKLVLAIAQYAASGWKAVYSILAQTTAWIGQKAVLLGGIIATKAAAAAQWLLNTSLLGCPIVWIIVGIAAVVAAVVLMVTHWKQVSAVLGKVFADIKAGFRDFVNFIIGGINSLISSALSPLNAIIKGLNKIPGVKLPSVSLEIPKVPAFAKGTNFFGGGAALVGENGPELIKLPRGSSVVNNQQTNSTLKQHRSISIAKLADQIIVREEADIDKITTMLAHKILTAEANLA